MTDATTDIIPATTFGRALSGATMPALDPERRDALGKSAVDRAVARAATAQDELEHFVIDLARVGALMRDRFAIAPAYCTGRRAYRCRDIEDGEVYYYVGAKHRKFAHWSMHFEPGVVMGYSGHGGRAAWRTASAIVPPIPAEHRPATTRGKFIVWEQEWTEKILLPRDPALIEHVVGDVYVVRAVWDITPLEAAALRGNR